MQPPAVVVRRRAQAILGDSARLVFPAGGAFVLGGSNVIDAIVGISTRHRLSEVELRRTLKRRAPGQVDETLAELAASGRAQRVERYGVQS